MSRRPFEGAIDEIDGERRALDSPICGSSLDHKEVYRIIDEAEFVDPDGFRTHYETAAARIAARLEEATAQGADARRCDPGDGSARLGDHGDERLPGAALRGVGQAGRGPCRGPRQRAARAD